MRTLIDASTLERAMTLGGVVLALGGLVGLDRARGPLATLVRDRPHPARRRLGLLHRLALVAGLLATGALAAGWRGGGDALAIGAAVALAGLLVGGMARLAAAMPVPPGGTPAQGRTVETVASLSDVIAGLEASPLPLALLLVECDHASRLDAALGQGTTQRVQDAVATALAGQVRACDRLVGLSAGITPAEVTAGPVFAVLCPACTHAGGQALGRRLRDAVARHPVKLERGGPLAVSASIGVAQHRPGEAPEAFIARAVAALDAARHEGRNRVRAA